MSIIDAAVADKKKSTAKQPPRPIPADTQQVCIDLPGEAIKCNLHKSKLQIVLRKHRDVIFELQLFKGMSYTVEAEGGDFYSVRDKKLFEARLKHKITFKDGERLHLWVGREFKGTLVLKANGKVLGRYEPNKLDTAAYDADPATKPAPLIVVMKNDPQPTQIQASRPPISTSPITGPGSTLGVPSYDPLTFSDASRERMNEQSMHVVEIKPDKDMPQQVADFFKHGGEQTALDSKGILTRNWLWIQIVGGIAYVGDNLPWIKDLWKEKFYLQRVKHKAGEKVYVVFKGNAGLRKFLTAARYGADNAKVLAITGGAGSAAGLRHSAWAGAKGVAKGGGALAVVFATVINVFEWLADYEQRDPVTGKPKKDFFDLAFKIGVDISKAVISAAIGSALIGVALMAAGAIIGAPIVVATSTIVVGTIIASVAIGYSIDFIDKHFGITENLGKSIKAATSDLKTKNPSDYENYEELMSATATLGMAP